ncbi:MAG: hypothetical protein O2894_06345 [Planctomycetota bacterium]|nr:hypothetical protein [Planctomycetota bacterium]
MTEESATDERAPTTTAGTGITSGSATTPPWRRFAIIGGVLAVVGIGLWFAFGERFLLGLHVSGLHSNDGRTRAAHVAALKEHPDKELVVELLLDAVADDDYAFDVRRLCADLVHRQFNRLSRLEQILRGSASVHTRGVILRSLMVEQYFEDEIVSVPAYRVRETIDEWLAKPGDFTRADAIQLAVRIQYAEAMPKIRPLVRRSGSPSAHSQQERDVMIAAAGAAEQFKDCEALGSLLDIARDDPDLLVRLRFMQIADRASGAGQPCAASISEDALSELVLAALADPAHEVRMGAILILSRSAEMAKSALPQLRAIVEGPAVHQGRDTGPERRHALEALIVAGDPDDIARIPAACLDSSVEVRSTAARIIRALPDAAFEGCWIGLLEDETENQGLWRDALDFFYKFARIGQGRLGFPPRMSHKAVNAPLEWDADLANVFGGAELTVAEDDGTFMRISRGSITEAHFKWWARRLGLEDEAVDQATAARQAFYAAKRRGDAAAAEAALASAPRAVGLWSYEDAWLASRSR